METEAYIVLADLAILLIVVSVSKVPYHLGTSIALAVVWVAGIIDQRTALSGFSNGGFFTIVCLLLATQALMDCAPLTHLFDAVISNNWVSPCCVKTKPTTDSQSAEERGTAPVDHGHGTSAAHAPQLEDVAAAADQLGSRAAKTEDPLDKPFIPLRIAMLQLQLVTGIASSVVNNTPLVALLLPIISRWAKRREERGGERKEFILSKLLLPLSYAGVFGGILSMLGSSTQFIVQGLLTEAGLEQIPVFELAMFGGPLFLFHLAYTQLFFRWMHAKATMSAPTQAISRDPSANEVRPASPVAAPPLPPPLPLPQPQVDSLLQTDTKAGSPHPQTLPPALRPPKAPREGPFSAPSSPTGPAHSNAPTLQKTNSVPHLQQSGSPGTTSPPQDSIFQRTSGRITPHRHVTSHEVAWITIFDDPPTSEEEDVQESRWRHFLRRLHGWGPVILLLAFCTAAATQVIDTALAALFLVIGLVVGRWLHPREAFSNLNAPMLVTIAASLSLAKAVEVSGLGENIASFVVNSSGSSPVAAFALLMAFTTILTESVNNNAAASIVFPVMLDVVRSTNGDLNMFVIGLCIAANTSFANPMGYATHLMVKEPGHYTCLNFFRIGIILDVLMWGFNVGLFCLYTL